MLVRSSSVGSSNLKKSFVKLPTGADAVNQAFTPFSPSTELSNQVDKANVGTVVGSSSSRDLVLDADISSPAISTKQPASPSVDVVAGPSSSTSPQASEQAKINSQFCWRN